MEYLTSFLLVLLLSVLAATKATIQSSFSRKNIKTARDSALFNCLAFAFIAIFLTIIFPPEFFTPKTFIYGIATGALMACFQIFYTLALKTGPISLSVLIVNFNVLIPAVFCIIVFKETVYLSYLFGVLLLICALLLSYKKDDASQIGTSFKWLVFVAIALISSGSYSTIQKYYVDAICQGQTNSNAFLLVTYTSAFITAFWVFGAMSIRKREEKTEKNTIWKFLLFSALIALVLLFFQKMYMYTVANTDGVFFNPTYLGLNSVIMSIVGIVIFKDKLTIKQKLSILLGIACVLFMNIRFRPL